MFKKAFSILSLLFSLAACGAGNTAPDLLGTPNLVVVDSTNERVFAIDNSNNGLSLIDPNTNRVVNDTPLSTINQTQILPTAPTGVAVAPLAGAISRLFVIGDNNGVTNQIIVLDYDTTNGIAVASISPITVTATSTDILGGIAYDSDTGLVFVTDSTGAELRAFNASTGAEDGDSPISLAGTPTSVTVDTVSNRVAVANAGDNNVSFINTTSLAAAVGTLGVGAKTLDVALVTNANGTILFLTTAQQNGVRVWNVNLAVLGSSVLLYSLDPVAPGATPPTPNLFTGTLNEVAAANLASGEIGAFITETSGDILVLDITEDLATLTPTIITIGAVSGEGIDLLLNGSLQATTVYYASPAVGAVTVVDPINNSFADQIP